MFKCEGKSYFVVTKNDLFDWFEIKALIKIIVKSITKFLWKDVICRHEIFGKLIMNEKSKNKKTVDEFNKRYEIKKIIIFDYHFQINEMIEKSHKFIVDFLSKMINGGIINWVQNLFAILWTNKIIVRQNIDHIFLYFNCDNESILFIELNYFTWRILSWNKIQNISNLIIMQIK